MARYAAASAACARWRSGSVETRFAWSSGSLRDAGRSGFGKRKARPRGRLKQRCDEVDEQLKVVGACVIEGDSGSRGLGRRCLTEPLNATMQRDGRGACRIAAGSVGEGCEGDVDRRADT
jgi:hypothetical protein